MMTAFTTISGMVSIAREQVVGLERLSPLADVKILFNFLSVYF